MAKAKTGLGADAFFQTEIPPAHSEPIPQQIEQEIAEQRIEGKGTLRPERRSFNLRPAILTLLDEIQIKSIREGHKSTLSAIVERGIELVAAEKGVSE